MIYPYPINVSTGEYKAGKESRSNVIRQPGRFIVTWHDYNRHSTNPVTKPRTYRFKVPKGTKVVLLKASGKPKMFN